MARGLDARKYFWRSGRDKYFSLGIPFIGLLARNDFWPRPVFHDLSGLSGLASGETSLSSNMSSRKPESLLDAPQ
jgi:hypothetical protein